MEEWIESKHVYEGRIVSVRTGNVLMDERTVAFREVVEHPGGVTVVPVLGDNVLLVRQFRIAIGRSIDELPAGKLEGEEDAETRARCELEEETGYRAGRLIEAGSIYASVGYSSERIRMFYAFDLTHVGVNPEFDESIEVIRLPLTEIEGKLRSNTLRDAKTAVGLYMLLDYLRHHPDEPAAQGLARTPEPSAS